MWQRTEHSQGGVIDSHSIHENELNTDGTFSTSKFRENMKFAAKEAVNRIDGVPYTGEQMSSFLAPDDADWVIEFLQTESDIHKFLSKDESTFRAVNNFIIRPYGLIWQNSMPCST